MITVSSTASSVLAGSGFVYRLAVESWLNGVLLADDVPVESAGEENDRSLAVPERLVLTVPRWVDGVDWAPKNELGPLAAKGQRLHVKLGVDLANGQTEWLTRGRFLIYNTESDEDSVEVEAVGLLHLIFEARLISPYQPTGTLSSTLRGLVEPALNILVDGALTDRAVPAAINYDEDRLGGVGEILDAWPARGYVDPEGYLRVVSAAQSTTPVFALTDAYGGTVITAAGGSSREDGANAIVARGTASDGSQVQGVAYLTTGPNAINGPFNPLPVPYFFQSPLLTTVGQAQAAAETIRNRRQLQTSREFVVTTVPNPALQVGDVGTLTSAANGLTSELVSIERQTLPYTAAQGSMPAMVLTCRTLA